MHKYRNFKRLYEECWVVQFNIDIKNVYFPGWQDYKPK